MKNSFCMEWRCATGAFLKKGSSSEFRIAHDAGVKGGHKRFDAGFTAQLFIKCGTVTHSPGNSTNNAIRLVKKAPDSARQSLAKLLPGPDDTGRGLRLPAEQRRWIKEALRAGKKVVEGFSPRWRRQAIRARHGLKPMTTLHWLATSAALLHEIRQQVGEVRIAPCGLHPFRHQGTVGSLQFLYISTRNDFFQARRHQQAQGVRRFLRHDAGECFAAVCGDGGSEETRRDLTVRIKDVLHERRLALIAKADAIRSDGEAILDRKSVV